eukprot:1859439-Karenia_brevis.AAC.1
MNTPFQNQVVVGLGQGQEHVAARWEHCTKTRENTDPDYMEKVRKQHMYTCNTNHESAGRCP